MPSVVLAIETGGWWSEETVRMIRQLAIALARDVPRYMTRQVRGLGSDAGQACCPLHALSLSLSRPSSATLGATQAARHRDSWTCWRRIRGCLSGTLPVVT